MGIVGMLNTYDLAVSNKYIEERIARDASEPLPAHMASNTMADVLAWLDHQEDMGFEDITTSPAVIVQRWQRRQQ